MSVHGDTQQHDKRVLSIDALRGFDMFWIVGGAWILRNTFRWLDNPDLRPLANQFRHSRWDGFTFYDLVFPLFLFIVGVSALFAINRRREKGESWRVTFSHIVRRSLLLVFLGLLCNGLMDFDFSDLYYSGVLQRIGICYFFAATLVLNTGIRTQSVAFCGILLGYWGLMTLIPAPGFEAGDLSRQGNLSGYIDRLLLPGSLGYHYGDNEGILSTLPAIATTLLGVLTGHWLRTSRSGERKTVGLFVAGIISLLLGGIWNLAFPINKLLWTSSYVLWAGGWSLLLLALFYYVINVRGYRRWTLFFVVIGMNAITVYVGQDIIPFNDITGFFLSGCSRALGDFGPVLSEIGEMVIKWSLLYYLYRTKIFLKV